MSSPQRKTLIERITINNILAFMVIGAYTGGWVFLIVFGVTNSQSLEDSPLLILQLVQDLKELIVTMTIIVVLVIQFFFRTSPTENS
jgi:hypothetical protein